MKASLPGLIILLILLITSVNSLATHLVGFHLTAQYAGSPDTYNIKCYYYRDCTGVSQASTVTMYYKTGSFIDSITLVQTSSSVQTSSVSCVIIGPTPNCTSLIGNGIEKITYEAQLTLPFQDSAWVLFVSECCFSPVIFASTAQDICTEAQLNTFITPADNLPEFISIPDFEFCLNATVNYTQTATDMDGDSIVYSLIPIACNNMPAIYNSPYSGTNFILSSTPITFNYMTGTCSFTPNALMIGYLSIKATEYRNGIAIGSVMRNTSAKTNNNGTPAGVNENINLPKIIIVPNPVNNLFQITATKIKDATLFIQDITGRVLIKQNFYDPDGSGAIVDVQRINAGIYSVSLYTAKEILVTKFVKE